MRTRTRATWIGSALALALATTSIAPGARTAAAEPKAPAKPRPKPDQVSVTACVKYAQRQDDGGINLSLRSACTADLECSISWALRCEGDAADQKRQEARAFTLMAGQTGGAYAAADACGDKGWTISAVHWSCRTADE